MGLAGLTWWWKLVEHWRLELFQLGYDHPIHEPKFVNLFRDGMGRPHSYKLYSAYIYIYIYRLYCVCVYTYATNTISYAQISGDPQPLGGSKLSGRTVSQSLRTWQNHLCESMTVRETGTFLMLLWHAFDCQIFQQWANHIQTPKRVSHPINSHKTPIKSH